MLAGLTTRRAALITATAAMLVYLPALGNRYALDDSPIVENNPTAHSVAAALRAFDEPYWPPEHGAGLWRPLVILSFAADYQLSSGSTTWLHGVNVLLHAAVSALFVAVAAAWLPAAAALAAGVAFAVHPVHVEAVANLVGRAELLAALFLLGAMLMARRQRSWPNELAVVLLIVMALLSKEHAVIAVPLLWLDSLARPPQGRPLRPRIHLVVITIAWLVIRGRVEGGAGFDAVAPTFIDLGAGGRISTMMAAFLTVVRLMVWPFDLSPDYHPMVIERLEGPTIIATLGALVFAAVVLLAIVLWRRQRAVSTGLLLAGLAWFPTSNLLIPTGIVLAERTLYLPSAGIVLALAATGMLIAPTAARALLALALASWTLRTVTRIPEWRNTQSLVVGSLLAHPESYKVHQSAARVFIRLGDRQGGQREYRTAAAIFGGDPYMLTEAAANAIEIGRGREAMQLLQRSEMIDSNQSLTHQLLSRLELERGSVAAGLLHARAALRLAPLSAEAARLLAAAHIAGGNPDSARAVWPAFESRGGDPFDAWLLRATTYAATGNGDSARFAFRQAAMRVPDDSTSRRRLGEAGRLLGVYP